MRKLFFYMLTLCGLTSAMAADYTIDYTGLTSDYSNLLPSDIYEKYSISQQIYTAEELQETGAIAGDLTGISFIAAEAERVVTRSWRVYVATTTQSDYKTDGFVPMTDADQVFNGEVTTLPLDIYDMDNCWYTITFSKPISWDGNSNLLICVVDETGTLLSRINHLGVYANDSKRAASHSGATAYDATVPPSAPKATRDMRTAITFHITDPATGITTTRSTLSVSKQLRNGQLLIQHEGKAYNAGGAVVK